MSSFAKSIFTLSIGNLIAQIISIGLMPVITRLYDPASFGVFSLYVSIIMIVYPISTLRFNAAIMLPRDDSDSACLLLLSCFSVLISSLVLIPAVLLILKWVGWNEGMLGSLIWLVPIGVLIQGIFHSVNFWTIRNKRFNLMSIATISGSVADRGLVMLWAILFNTSPLGLIMGRIIGPLMSLCMLCYGSIFPFVKELKQAANWDKIKKLAIRYKDFPLLSSWSFLASALSRELPTILLAVLYSPVVAGFYSLGLRVMNMPMMLVGDAIAKAYLQKTASEKGNGSEFEYKTRKLITYAVILTLPFAVAIIISGKQIFSWVFGEKWLEAGAFIQILMLVFICLFLYRILSAIFDVYEKQKQRLRLEMLMLTARSVPLLLVSYFGGSEYRAMYVLAISSFIIYVISFGYLFSVINLKTMNLMKTLYQKLTLFIPFVFAIYMITYKLEINSSKLMLLLAIFTAIQYMFVVITDKHLRYYVMKFMYRH